jgi:putative hydrolase of the HAD superfamily
MTSIRAVFFDAGNTLVHFDYDYLKSVLEHAGCAASVEGLMRAEYQAKFDLDKTILENLPQLMGAKKVWATKNSGDTYFTTILHAADVPVEHHTLILEKLWEKNAALELWAVVQEGTHDTLARIKAKGYTLGLISNSDGRLAGKLKALGLCDYFGVVIDSGVVGVEKPNPQIFQMGLSGIGVAAEESMYVGDIYSIDVIGARSAGLRPVLLDRLGLYQHVDCQTIRTVTDLLEIL